MNNFRGLYPPLYGATPSGGGGGGGQHIQVDALPEASLQYKDKIVQYVGASTETLTNGYFYKCVEHTETEGGTITVTYSWDPVAVMEVSSGGGATVEYTVTADGVKNYQTLLSELINAVTLTPDTKNYILCIGASRYFIQYVTTTTLNYKGTINGGSVDYEDSMIISKSSITWYRNNSSQTDRVPSSGTIITLYSI